MIRSTRNSKIKRILSGRGGESLIESVISILVFTAILASVSAIISISLRITSVSRADANDSQNEINEGIMENFSGDNRRLTLSGGLGADVEIPVVISPAGTGFEAFKPQ